MSFDTSWRRDVEMESPNREYQALVSQYCTRAVFAVYGHPVHFAAIALGDFAEGWILKPGIYSLLWYESSLSLSPRDFGRSVLHH